MRFQTWAVLAGAYKGRDVEARSLLTHSVEVSGEPKALCRVNSESLTDDGRGDTLPTCPTCRNRDPRFKGPESLRKLLRF